MKHYRWWQLKIDKCIATTLRPPSALKLESKECLTGATRSIQLFRSNSSSESMVAWLQVEGIIGTQPSLEMIKVLDHGLILVEVGVDCRRIDRLMQWPNDCNTRHIPIRGLGWVKSDSKMDRIECNALCSADFEVDEGRNEIKKWGRNIYSAITNQFVECCSERNDWNENFT